MPSPVALSAEPKAGDDAKFASFFAEPAADKMVLDFDPIDREFLAALSATGEATTPLAGRRLLTPDYNWTDATTGKPRVPMALCEFVAYKAALAYAAESVIARNLGGATNFAFFDSSMDAIADTQGFGFFYDGMVFIIMRGSERSKGDWSINLDDDFTDELHDANKKLIARLEKRHGKGVDAVLKTLEERPGRHMGFAIAWAAVNDKVAKFLDGFPADTPIVLSGHSLGGALALIGADELKHQGRNVAAVITFGAPLVGTKTFLDDYNNSGLGRITVRFEAVGDSVPRVMRGWYYRLPRSGREFLLGLVRSAPGTAKPKSFLVVGNPWEFRSQPPLSDKEVVNAIQSIIEAKARAAKEEQEKREKEAAEKSRKEAETKVGGSQEKPTGEAKPKPDAAKPSSDGQGTGGGYSRVVVLLVVGLVALIVFGILWLVVRRKLAAHAIMERYALYLSTLSYQKIRSLRAGDPGGAAERLAQANSDLDRYLCFIRGETGTGSSFFQEAKLTKLPVRLAPDLDLQTFLSDPNNII